MWVASSSALTTSDAVHAAEGAAHDHCSNLYVCFLIRLCICLADAAHGPEGAAHDDHHDDVFHTAAHIFEDQAITKPAYR
jgi:hypothetical protein